MFCVSHGSEEYDIFPQQVLELFTLSEFIEKLPQTQQQK